MTRLIKAHDLDGEPLDYWFHRALERGGEHRPGEDRRLVVQREYPDGVPDDDSVAAGLVEHRRQKPRYDDAAADDPSSETQETP